MEKHHQLAQQFTTAVAKTNSMLVATKQKYSILKSRNEDLDLKIRDNELEIIQKTQYLGERIDKSRLFLPNLLELLAFENMLNFPNTGNIEDSIHRYC